MDISNVVVLIFFGALLVPVLLYVAEKYEAPDSFNISLRHVAWLVAIVPVVFAAMNFLAFGWSFAKWQWGSLIGLGIALPLRLLIDWFAIRHRNKLENP